MWICCDKYYYDVHLDFKNKKQNQKNKQKKTKKQNKTKQKKKTKKHKHVNLGTNGCIHI